jgi:hypothetical protein
MAVSVWAMLVLAAATVFHTPLRRGANQASTP